MTSPFGKVHIVEAQAGSDEFAQILSLWRANSSTLGFMPVGGFEDASENGTLLAACDEGGRVRGYVMYRVSRKHASITHLCVSFECRGQGIARKLADVISERHPDSFGVGLWCRKDFDANKIWQHFGFSARKYRNGRGGEKKTLVFWYRGHGHRDLFSYNPSSLVEAVVDSCVLFDILDGDPALEREESRALAEDWLQDSVRLLITPEVGNDIQRDNDLDRLARRNSGKSGYDEISVSPASFQSALHLLSRFLPSPQDEQTAGDYRHLAWTLAAGIRYFLTRDTVLLKVRNPVPDRDLKIMSPGEFIRHVDELERSEVYRPEMLFGTQFSFQDAADVHMGAISRMATRGERPSALLASIRNLMSNPRRNKVRVLLDSNGGVQALLAEANIKSNPTIYFFRLARTSLAPTLADFIVSRIINEHASRSPRVLSVVDADIADDIALSLSRAGFENSFPGAFSRNCCRAVLSSGEVAQIWGDLPEDRRLKESIVWPVKIEDCPEKVYIIPIKPYYAASLFDHELAGQNLFGSQNPDLLLQDESAYYSGCRHALSYPARILWYVSRGDGYSGTSAIRGCSFLQESVRGPAKQLYKKFRRFGVFGWREISDLAGGAQEDITAIRFSHTERFVQPISLAEIKGRLGSAPAGPRPIDYELFLQLYKTGMNL